jgi:hypothetical protein
MRYRVTCSIGSGSFMTSEPCTAFDSGGERR